MKELQVGKLYQVHNGKGWVIAEYVKPIPAHSYKYHNLNLDTFTTGSEKTRHVPDSHLWLKVRPKGFRSTFTVEDRGLQIRPLTEDAIAEIAQIKRDIDQLENDRIAKVRYLREFCE